VVDPTQIQQISQLPRARDQNFQDVYANAALTQLGPYDISITFQKGMEIAPGQGALVDQVVVTVSPQHFKALVKSLVETLDAYEMLYGKLAIPDSETTPLKTAAEITTLIRTAKEGAKVTPSSTEQPPPAKRSRGVRRPKEP
jgi:hypothetical protein